MAKKENPPPKEWVYYVGTARLVHRLAVGMHKQASEAGLEEIVGATWTLCSATGQMVEAVEYQAEGAGWKREK